MEKEIRIQDDLYEAVNGEWLKTAVIPEDRPTTGGFSVLDQEVEETLMKDFREMAEGKKSSDITGMEDAVRLYKKVLDIERRNREGIEPLLPLLHRIRDLSGVKELNEKAAELFLAGMRMPISAGVDADMKDATVHSFVIMGPDIILPDTTYYGQPQGEKFLEIYRNMAEKALAFCDLSKEQIRTYLDDTLAYDALIAKKVKSQLEWADYVQNYNPMKLQEACDYLKPYDFRAFLSGLYPEKLPEEVIAYDPKAIKEFNGYFTEENFEMFRHWSYVKTLLANTSALSEELYEIGTLYRRALTGVEKTPVLEKQAYQTASRLFSEPVGVYYGRTSFGEEAKKDIVSLVKKIIATYQKRIREKDFLAESTKEKAVLKLSTIAIKMGYPDEVREYYKRLKVSEEDSYFLALQKIRAQAQKEELEKLHKKVDRNEWLMPGHMVNACYDPSRNDITFPAAILQKPFYSLHQSISENLGGIGAVIGHEISHAFDNNGSHFDENGNLNDWWTKEDFAAFEKMTKDMIAQWDKIPFEGGEVSGELTVSENIADNGGMGVTVEIMHNTEGADFQKYFINWAKVWCQKAKPEYVQMLLKNDVHSPTKLRANIQVRNFDEWYEAFGVTEKDEMYIAPEKRIRIW